MLKFGKKLKTENEDNDEDAVRTTIESIEEKYNMDIDIFLDNYEKIIQQNNELQEENAKLKQQASIVYTISDISNIISNRLQYYDGLIQNCQLISSSYMDNIYVRREELTDIFDAFTLDYLSKKQEGD